MQNKGQRAQNRMLSKDPNPPPKIPPGKGKGVKACLNALQKQLHRDGVIMPWGGDPVAGAITYSLVKVATQDYTQYPSFYCPKCRRLHHFEGGVPCPLHPDDGELKLIVPEAKLQSNSVAAASKLIDKLYPNLASVNAQINIEGKLEGLAEAFVNVIVRFVPGDRRQPCMAELNSIIMALRSSDDPE